jgi:hypothetical protein
LHFPNSSHLCEIQARGCLLTFARLGSTNEIETLLAHFNQRSPTYFNHIVCHDCPLLQATSPSKRQKRSSSPIKGRYQDDVTDECTLRGIEDHVDNQDDDEEDDDDSILCERERSLLDHVLAIYEQYEEDSLVEQSHLRFKLTTSCGLAKIDSLQKKLADEKVKCSLFKVLTLLLQSDSSRSKGPDHAQRIDLMLQVKRIVLDHDLYTVKDVKRRFTCLFHHSEETCSHPFQS